MFKDAAGLWKEDKFRPLVVSVVNLVLNILSVRRFGLYGVILSTIIAMLVIGFPWLLYNTNKYLMNLDVKKYLFMVASYTGVIVFDCILTSFVCNMFSFNNLLLELLCKGLVCLLLPNLVFLLFFFKTKENKYLMSNIKKIKEKIKGGK